MGYETDWTDVEKGSPDCDCPAKCGSADIEVREWESSDGGHTDYHYRCKGCGKDWWAEGADA
ncbi:hypothetical protein [Devosia sp. Naph2]|uniref:hypothetical protein n=1 Tax=Devosia polycyclovorans TaxID=3345148 RepID=UPI0035D0D13F